MFAAEDDEEVGDHGGSAFGVEVEDVAFFEVGEGHFDHADGAGDDLGPGGDDGAGLLAAEHGGGDFRGVGEVGDAGFEDFDAGLGDSGLDFGFELVGDLLGVAAEGHGGGVVGVVVMVLGGEVAEGGLGLDVDEVVVTVDFEGGFGGVDHAPDDDGGDLDGGAVVVVDFELVGFEVADAEGDFLFGVEGAGVFEAGVADGAAVGAEELEDAGFVGRDGEEPAGGEEREDEEGDAEEDEGGLVGCACGDEAADGGEDAEEDEEKGDVTGGGLAEKFAVRGAGGMDGREGGCW